MGLFDWLRQVLGGSSERRMPAQPRPSAPVQPARGTAPAVRPQPKRPEPRRLNLDAAQFTPLSDEDVKSRAKGMGRPLWTNPWFGRRDLIPPTSDARTLLIDRGMVGHGLITPEELAEIHKVGEEMDRVRPDLALAKEMADQAVQRSEEERKAIKEQKKAEAAARKKQHAEQVALRKQTDIVYLGRGVSSGLADRRANVEKLQQLGLPMLATPADLAKALNVPIPKLRWLAFHSEAAMATHYIRFTVPKKSGGTRELAAPHRDLASCQQWILVNILEKLPTHAAANGFVRGRNTVTNASAHVGRGVVLNTDLKDFFPTVTFPRVRGIFQGMGYSPAVATILALICTESPRRRVEYAGKTYHVATGSRALPQGACTSPALSNVVARRLDARLNGIATKLGWTYTRYADDMTFSADGEPAKLTAYLMARVRHIAEGEGFVVNEKKTRVQRRNTAQTVTGVVVNTRPGISRHVVRRMRAILHRAGKEGLAAQNRQQHPHFEVWVRGMIAYISMVNPKQGQPLRSALDALTH